MANEKFTLTWHSYASHFQGVLGNLFDTGESSDVTLVCDDQVKFKAHKFILKSCSPVFESILNEANESKSVVYLRGVNQLELKPILNFIYSGQASFYQKRMKDFLKIGKDLQIKEIKEMPEEKEEMVDIGENMVDQPHHDVISEEVSSEENESVDENDIARYESRQQERMKDFLKIGKDLQIKEIKDEPEEEEMVDIGENVTEKPHHDVISEDVKYPCSQCDFKTSYQRNLKKHRISS